MNITAGSTKLAFDSVNVWVGGPYGMFKRLAAELPAVPAEPANTPTYFIFLGSFFEYSVPFNCRTIDTKIWGAGGGSFFYPNYGSGGEGGFTSVTLSEFGYGGERSSIQAVLAPSRLAIAGGGGSGGLQLARHRGRRRYRASQRAWVFGGE